MKYLRPGCQSQERLDLLISLTSIRSDDVKEGLSWHLIKGHPIETAAALVPMKPAVLHRAIDTVGQVAQIVEQIKQHDRFSRFDDNGMIDDVPVDEVG